MTEAEAQVAAEFTRHAIRREAWVYAMRKPGKVAPADSTSRPQLAWLWYFAYQAVLRQPDARSFAYAGATFGIVLAAGVPHVYDWDTRELLVRPPNSFEVLDELLDANPCTAPHGGAALPKDPT